MVVTKADLQVDWQDGQETKMTTKAPNNTPKNPKNIKNEKKKKIPCFGLRLDAVRRAALRKHVYVSLLLELVW